MNFSGKQHAPVTVTDSSEIDFTLTGQNITASLITGSIDISKLDSGVQTSLGLSDTSIQPLDNISELTNDAGYTTNTGDVVGPGSATNNAVARFDTTTGKLIQNSNATIGDGGGFTVTVEDGGNEDAFTVYQNDVTNNPSSIYVQNKSNSAEIYISKQADGSQGPHITFLHDTSSPAIDDEQGLQFKARNSGGSVFDLGVFSYAQSDTTAGAEYSHAYFNLRSAGSDVQNLLLGAFKQGSTTTNFNGIGIGSSSGAGYISSNGNQDLVLQTGNATTGNITLTDGANGNITLSPNGTGTVYIGTTIDLGDTSDTTLSRVSAGQIAVEGVQIVTTSNAVTLDNKRITKRVGSTASSATPTINTDNVDVYRLTAQAVDITSFTTNLSGTPNHDDALIIEITDDGTARAITWGASFEASGNVALPTTTVISTLLRVGFLYNSATSKWTCVAVA